ncbi:MAG: hypothetical protein IKR88_07065 [Bacteroidales bacterium]|nr:hypothetical protein [Bacteroidales bacterium]
MKRVLLSLFFSCLVLPAFSNFDEPLYWLPEGHSMHLPRTSQAPGTQPLIEFYNDGVTPVVYVDVVPSSSSVLVFIINLDTMEEFYDIAEAGDTAIDIDITGTQGRYEVFYSADGEVPTGYANIGYAGNFNIW